MGGNSGSHRRYRIPYCREDWNECDWMPDLALMWWLAAGIVTAYSVA